MEYASELSSLVMERGSVYPSPPFPPVAMAYPIGNPFPPYIQVVHMQAVNRFSQGLWTKYKKQAKQLR